MKGDLTGDFSLTDSPWLGDAVIWEKRTQWASVHTRVCSALQKRQTSLTGAHEGVTWQLFLCGCGFKFRWCSCPLPAQLSTASQSKLIFLPFPIIKSSSIPKILFSKKSIFVLLKHVYKAMGLSLTSVAREGSDTWWAECWDPERFFWIPFQSSEKNRREM